VLANLYPLFGVVALGWEVFPLVFLFWCESAAIGIFNLAKLAVVTPEDPISLGEKFFALPFFGVHYGGFLAFHGLFVITVFGGDLYPELRGLWPTPTSTAQILSDQGLVLAVTFLFLSHGVSFIRNYLGRGEFRRTNVKTLWFAPYGRVIVMHVTILACGFLLDRYGSPVPALVALVALKTALDLWAHLRERQKLAGQGTKG
jgi:hypothetical protein